MTVRVVKKIEGNDVLEGVKVMMEAMVDDYTGFMPPTNDTRKKMNAEYAEKLTATTGRKYIKVYGKGMGVKAFIVNTDKDKKFKLGDILMPAGWAKPARNAARGNVLEGNYDINWTGAVYL